MFSLIIAYDCGKLCSLNLYKRVFEHYPCLPEAGHGPLLSEMSSMAITPASPPTVASRITWSTFCEVTWLRTSRHSSPWFPDFCHTYRKHRRLIHASQWGCESVCATPWYKLNRTWILFCNKYFTIMKSIITKSAPTGCYPIYCSIARRSQWGKLIFIEKGAVHFARNIILIS